MLRAGPNGVQRIVPSSLKTSGNSDGNGAAKRAVGVGGANAGPSVLSFKTVVGKASGAAPPRAQAPLTPAPRTKAAPPKAPVPQSRVKEEEGAQEMDEDGPVASKEQQEAKEDPRGRVKEESDWGVSAAKGMPPGTMMPTAKRPPPSKPSMAPSIAKQSKVDPKEEPQGDVEKEADDGILENDDWATQFEKKWREAMGEAGGVKEEGAPEDDAQPPAKRQRTGPEPVSAKAKLGPRQPPGPPPKHLGTPNTPGRSGLRAPGAGGVAGPAAEAVDNDAKLREEHPEWAARCTIEAAKPGQPQRLTISMAEVELGDDGLVTWCQWMDRRLATARPGGGAGGRVRFRAGTIDFSENELSAAGVKALCATLEKQGVRSEVLRLTGNNIGNEGIRCIAKFLTSSSQAPAQELHLSRNKVTAEGVKWLLGSLAVHPAYPVWNNETERFVPLWLRIENNKIKAGAGYAALQAASSSLFCSICTGQRSGETKCGPRQCVNVGCSDELKHNCVAHLTGWSAPEGADALPAPGPHARPLFAAPGRGAAKAPPSGVEEPVREEPRVIYEDDDLAVVLKPAGWSCLPQPKGVDPAWARLKPLARRKQVGELLMQTASAPPLQAWLLLHFGPDPNCDASRDQGSDRGLAHRLDLDTSGPILIGKTLKGYEHARKQVLAGLLKDYVALVHGSLPTERGEIVAPIDASAYAELKRVRVDSSGQPATTVWEAIAEYESPDQRDERYTLVQCRVGTLRTHQIRAHLEHLGHPVVGDRLYGNGDPPSFCPRTFLHKLRIGFFNVKGQTCVECSSLQAAPDLWNALGCLRKVGGMAMKGCGAPGL
mmetsp:Transcript_123047/g.359201  ORF Transcript_123047/g.359201 Transcript_123047/m.359201 type:complete len:826 (+) Transcript_123047:56-2533(+)